MIIPVELSLAQNASDKDPTLREYPGIVKPIRKFLFSARFDGLLTKINFVPGQVIKEGEVVFEFSSTSKQLALERSRAQRQSAEANLRKAESTLQRYRKLAKKDAIALTRIEDAEIARDIAASKLKEAQSTEKISEIILGNMKLRAPFTGIISPPNVSAGTFIDLDSRTSKPLAEIVQMDPIYVVAQVPYNVFYERRTASRNEKETLERAKWTLILPNGKVYPYEGRLISADSHLDKEGQTLATWAVFPNPDFLLRPDLKVTVQSRIPGVK